MLIEYRVQNHRSIRDEQVLNLEATVRTAEAGSGPQRQVGHSAPLLPAVALYGANASGKSNVLDALGYMCTAVVDSHRRWEPEQGVPRDPFAWGAAARDVSLHEATFIIDGARYQYGFVADDERFVEEWLFAWPRKRKQTWFARDAQSFRLGEHLRGDNRLVEKATRPNALFLSTAAQHHHEQLLPVYRWFSRLALINVGRGAGDRFYRPWHFGLAPVLTSTDQPSLHGDDPQRARADMLLALLRAADVGIEDLKVVADTADPLSRVRRRPQVLVKHDLPGADGWLPLEEESHGTLALVWLAVPMLEALQGGGVLVVDELERSLHPLLAAHIVRQFNDPAVNRHNAQIIFSTHDTHLLGTTAGDPLLRRDQIWLTEKDREGASVLYPMSDYKPRKHENLERGYLQGRYGAIPFLGELGRLPE